MSTASSPAPRRGKKASAEAVEAVTAPRPRLAKAPVKDPVTGKAEGVKAAKTKLTSWMPVEDAGQVRAAFLATRGKTGYRSLTDLINTAVMKEVRLLQTEHNRGRAWKPAKPGDVPTGRPL
jgi:hypothetical protein